MRKFFFLIIIIGHLTSPTVTWAATILVPEDYSTIQDAVDAAYAGDTIIVGEGIYTENILVEKPVTLMSANGPEATTVIASDKASPTLSVKSVNGLILRGFTLTDSSIAGLVIRDTVKSRVVDIRATGNNSGILVYNSSGNTFEGNSGDSNEFYGIYLEHSHDNLLTFNSASRNRDRGLFISYSHRNRIVDNDFNLNTWNGITLWESNENLIKDNLTLRNTYGIVIGNSSGNELTDNTSLPNVFIILPILLLYLGILNYLIQKNILKYIYGK